MSAGCLRQRLTAPRTILSDAVAPCAPSSVCASRSFSAQPRGEVRGAPCTRPRRSWTGIVAPTRERAMTPARGPKIFHGNWITVLMMYVLFFTAGMGLYSYQVFVPRFVEDFGWTMFQTVGPAALWAVVFGLSGFFVGGWIQRHGARRVIVSGALGGAVLFFLTSMITQLWQLYVLLMLSGITVAATTLVPAQTVITLWFHKQRGRNMGLAMMGVGLGGFALPPLVAWLIQEVGWRATYRLQALATVLLVIPPVLLFLKSRPSDIGEVPDGRAAAGS